MKVTVVIQVEVKDGAQDQECGVYWSQVEVQALEHELWRHFCVNISREDE